MPAAARAQRKAGLGLGSSRLRGREVGPAHQVAPHNIDTIMTMTTAVRAPLGANPQLRL